MGPLELHERFQRRRQEIADKLEAAKATDRSGGCYAEAYGELNALAVWMAVEVAKLDPSFGLAPMDYDAIIAREA